MDRSVFVAALQEHGIPATTVEDCDCVWFDFEHELADPVAIHRALQVAGAKIRFDDWIEDVTTHADPTVIAWLERWWLH